MSGETTRYEVDFKKTPGILTVTESHIAWNAKEPGAMDRQSQALQRATNMLASKADSKKVSLKILFKDDIPVGGLLFTFTAATAREDRQKVQDTLIPFVSANRAGVAPPNTAPATGASTPGGTGSPAGTGSAAPTPGPSTPAGPSSVVGKGKRKAEDGSGRLANGKAVKPINFELRKRVLNKNPTLKMLHRELVLGKQITEEEFWEGREALLHAEEMAQAQKPGRASALPDDRFDLDTGRKTAKGQGGTGVGIKKQDTGPIVVSLTKERIRDLFDAFPVLQDAYARYVPGISEVEFWQRYFSSQLLEQHRASARKSANDEVKKDDIFDQYLEEPDWNLAPRNAQDGNVESYLNLAATQEDHGGGETDVVRDFTMQAGRERSSLPLIRRFNEHSNRLLRKGDATKTAQGDDDEIILDDRNIYQEIDLEDLHGPAAPAFIALDVQDAANNVNGEKEGITAKGVMPGRPDEELLGIAAREAQALQAWQLDFSQTSLSSTITQADKDAGLSPEQKKVAEAYTTQRECQAVAMYVVKEMHNASNAENATSRPLPQDVMEQMRSCHNAATEFLRQYWSAVLPTPAGALGAGTTSTSAGAKAAKAAKMAGYLRGTAGKVEAVVHIATEAGVDPGRIRAALAPTIGAVDLALRREQRRLAAS